MTSISYADVNRDILKTLERPKPAYFLLLIGFATAMILGVLSIAIQVDVGQDVVEARQWGRVVLALLDCSQSSHLRPPVR